MAQNRMFALEISDVKKCALITRASDAKIWHLSYGHLNVNGLKLLSWKNIAVGLLKIDALDFCEGGVYGKQSRNTFPVNKSWSASTCLELIYADVCGPMSVESFGGS